MSTDPERDPIEYLLNAFERASQSDSPSTNGYGEKRRALLDAIRELRRQSRASRERQGWEPIGSAPKDKLLLLAAEFDRPGDWRIKVGGHWDDEWHVFGASWEPTHWQPLPAPPAAPPSGEGT